MGQRLSRIPMFPTRGERVEKRGGICVAEGAVGKTIGNVGIGLGFGC